ncbi:MAG: hypothetical protein M3Y57_22295 [Acidobacteriota bacterium]|nr:hypothetical protein [Acidobacteriota bacterium]
MKRTLLSLQEFFSKSGYTAIKSRGRYLQDGLFTVHSDEFRKDAAFRAAYERGIKAGNGLDLQIEWRVHTALWAGSTCLDTAGGVVEW